MSEKTFWTLVVAVCAAGLIVWLAMIWGVAPMPDGEVLVYDNPEGYAAGNGRVEDPVRVLEVEWSRGQVILDTHPGSGVTFRETSARDIPEDLRLRWQLDGDVLRIHSAASGSRPDAGPEKTLALSLPEGLTPERVEVRTTSADVRITELTAETLAAGAVSGSISGTAWVRHAEAAVTSGDVLLTLAGETETASLATTEGRVSLTAESVDTVRLRTTSGFIHAGVARAGEFRAEATAGGVSVELGRGDRVNLEGGTGAITARLGALGTLQASSSSGNVVIRVPQTPGCTARLDSARGLTAATGFTRQADGSWRCGDGSASVTVSTASGNILLSAGGE